MLPFASHVQALTFTVGDDSQCSHATVQAAVEDLPVSGTHEIRVATNQEYLGQAIRIEDLDVVVRGGYAHCGQVEEPNGDQTVLSGAGGARNSVMTIIGFSHVSLENLALVDGDEEDDSGNGGGLDFNGAGDVTLVNVNIEDSTARFGGGISVNGNGGHAILWLEDNVQIFNNDAVRSGGGIRVLGDARLMMLGHNIRIYDNRAHGDSSPDEHEGYGGGIQVIAPARVDIGTDGVVENNSAQYGGGISINGNGDVAPAVVRVFARNPAQPVRIIGNTAERTGGGVYLEPEAGFATPLSGSIPYFCARNFQIDRNIARNGAAIYADLDIETGTNRRYGGHVVLGDAGDTEELAICDPEPDETWGAVDCAAGSPCTTIDGNLAHIDGQEDGAIVLVQSAGRLDANRLSMGANLGRRMIETFSDTRLHSCLIAGNAVDLSLIDTSEGGDIEIDNCTLAGNTMNAGTAVLTPTGSLTIRRSIIWQPDNVSLFGGLALASNVLASETGTLGSGTNVFSAHPRFVDAARGDYHLQAASPAVDYAFAIGDGIDLDQRPQDIDLPRKQNAFGSVDLGAFERQDLLPLVLNGDFNRDLNLWWWGPEAATVWDADNRSGPAGSGSTKAILSPAVNGELWAQSQCVFIPGPGAYRLSGYAHSSGGTIGTMDRPRLHWQFRAQATDWCSDTQVTRFGDINFPASNSWAAPVEQGTIVIADDEWTPMSSLTVYLVVTEGLTASSTSAWFDGITLLPIESADTIFADGFE